MTTEFHTASGWFASKAIVAGLLLLAPIAASAADTPEAAPHALEELLVKDGQFLPPGRDPREATMENIVGSLRETYTNANIVLAPNIRKIKIDDLRYRQGDDGGGNTTNLLLELQALAVASGDKFTVDFDLNAPAQPVYYLKETPSAKANSKESGDPSKVVEVFNLSHCHLASYVENKISSNHTNEDPSLLPTTLGEATTAEVQDIVTSTAQSLGIDTKGLTFKFFPNAQLMVVVGPPDAVTLTSRIVDALSGQAWSEQPGFGRIIDYRGKAQGWRNQPVVPPGGNFYPGPDKVAPGSSLPVGLQPNPLTK